MKLAKKPFSVLLFICFLPFHATAEERIALACDDGQTDEAQSALEVAVEIIETTVEKLRSPDFDTSSKAILLMAIPNEESIDGLIEKYERVEVWSNRVRFLCLINSHEKAIYAQVVTSDFFIIQLGSEFFLADDEGYDSKSGVLIHEMMHFFLVGAANYDPEYSKEYYGIKEAIQLAIDDPDAAQNNAENFQLLAESIYWDLAIK